MCKNHCQNDNHLGFEVAAHAKWLICESATNLSDTLQTPS